MDYLDARIGLRVLRKHAPDMSLGGAVIGDTEFPPVVCLGAYAFDRLAKQFFRRIVRRHNDREEVAFREELRKPLHFGNVAGGYGVVGLNPLLVTAERLCLSPLIGPVPEIMREWIDAGGAD